MGEKVETTKSHELDQKEEQVIHTMLASNRAVVWALYEYSLFRNQSLSKHLHMIIRKHKFFCHPEDLNLCLTKSLDHRFWKDKYDLTLPVTILAISRLDALAQQLTFIRITLETNPTDYLDRLDCDSWAIESLLLFVFWMLQQNKVASPDDHWIKLFANLVELRVLFLIINFTSKTSMNLEELIKVAKTYFQFPVILNRNCSLMSESEKIKDKFESLLQSPKKMEAYVCQRLKEDLVSLCDPDRNQLLSLKQMLQKSVASRKSQIEILFSNLTFVSDRLSGPIFELIQLLLGASAGRYTDRIIFLMEKTLIQIQRLTNRLNQLSKQKKVLESIPTAPEFLNADDDDDTEIENNLMELDQESVPIVPLESTVSSSLVMQNQNANVLIIKTLRESSEQTTDDDDDDDTANETVDWDGENLSSPVYKKLVAKYKLKNLEIKLKHTSVDASGTKTNVYS